MTIYPVEDTLRTGRTRAALPAELASAQPTRAIVIALDLLDHRARTAELFRWRKIRNFARESGIRLAQGRADAHAYLRALAYAALNA